MTGHQVVNEGDNLQIMDGSCKYIVQAVSDSQQGVVLQLGGWAWGQIQWEYRRSEGTEVASIQQVNIHFSVEEE
jgi:hypothetical protein